MTGSEKRLLGHESIGGRINIAFVFFMIIKLLKVAKLCANISEEEFAEGKKLYDERSEQVARLSQPIAQ